MNHEVVKYFMSCYHPVMPSAFVNSFILSFSFMIDDSVEIRIMMRELSLAT